MSAVAHWADVLHLRPEVLARRGHAEGLQMSLYDAVYQVSEVPYRDANYWCDITEPTVKLVEFMAEIVCLFSDSGIDGQLFGGHSVFHLDQGMGGGKSHALTGLWHLASSREAFFASDIGTKVRSVAEHRANGPIRLDGVRPVVLCADHFTPGAARPEFGPATNLHQRFLWGLFAGDRLLYDTHVAAGTDKAAIKDALAAVDRPVLILLDEIMDYAMALAGPEHRDSIPAEQAFLNALTGAVNEAPRAVMVTVMIRSDLDEQGYEGPAADFRSYVAKRLERNGTTRSVNEPQDFGAIIRRRIFARTDAQLPTDAVAQAWRESASAAWREQVFDRLAGARQLGGFAVRLERSYPFHPDLLDLVEHDWTQYAGFQRVRSTVEVFSTTAYWWTTEHAEGRWTPELIGVGDIPLHAAGDDVLSSGLLHGNERQIVGMRQVAEKDITSTDRTDGQAVLADKRLASERPWLTVQPQPAVRLATALWMYSVAVRAQGKQGATKAELLAALYVPADTFGFADAEEVFNALTDDEDERGLGALDVRTGGGGSQPHRYVLVTQLNKRMFQRNALNRTTPELSYELVWERVRAIANKGSGFDTLLFIEKPADQSNKELKDIFGEVDQRRSNRLVVLDPQRWTLLNGRDEITRSDIEAVLGLGEHQMSVDFAASCVIACVNTQRRDTMVKRARGAYAWQLAFSELDPTSDIAADMAADVNQALTQLDMEIRRSFQHYAYLVRDNGDLRVEFVRFDDDALTSLSGNQVWEDLAGRGDAVIGAQGLAGSYLHQLLDLSDRNYTLSEVVEKFWRDPVFPIIPNEGVARRAIFDALRHDQDGVAWELVTAGGEPLHAASPEQLAINSSDQYLRLAAPAGETDEGDPAAPPDRTRLTPPTAPAGLAVRTPGGPVQYHVHELVVTNRSLSNVEAREQLFQLASALADALDPSSGIDVQVASIRIELNAAADSLTALRQKARASEADWEDHPEDF
jgi:hypothetical protein